MKAIERVDTGGTLRPTGDVQFQIVAGARFDATVTKAPRRGWLLFLKEWVARPAIGALVRDAVEWLLGLAFRRRRREAA